MYCETCHKDYQPDLRKPGDDALPYIFDLSQVADHITHKFESLQKYREERLEVRVKERLKEGQEVNRGLAQVTRKVKAMYDGIT